MITFFHLGVTFSVDCLTVSQGLVIWGVNFAFLTVLFPVSVIASLIILHSSGATKKGTGVLFILLIIKRMSNYFEFSYFTISIP